MGVCIVKGGAHGVCVCVCARAHACMRVHAHSCKNTCSESGKYVAVK